MTTIRTETLSSGVTVLLREAQLAPVVEVQIWAAVGSADEGPGEAGLAHFLEHMHFKGTETRGVGEIAGAVESAGGRINAFTSFDATCYHATLPAEAAGLGLDVLADAVLHSRFDASEVAREIEVVQEEIRRSQDDPHHVLGDALFAAAFSVHPYRAPVLGSPASVASFTPERLRRFCARWYAPDNLTLVVTGAFDAEDLRSRAEAAFAGARPSGAARARPPEPVQRGLRLRVVERDFERAALELCWPAVPLRHPDAPLLDLLAFVLGQGESSRLDRRVKEELGLADRIDTSCYTPLDPGIFGIGADLDAERAPELLAAVAREVETLRAEPVGADELEKARRNFLAAKAWEMESVSAMARKLGSARLLTGDPAFEDAYLARVREASREDLLRVAREWLTPERQTLALVAPHGATPPEAELRAALGRGAESARGSFRPPSRAAAAHPGAEAYTIGHGIRLLVQPRREVAVVSARAALLGGQLVESEATAGLSRFTSSLWLRGTQSHGAAEFARSVEALAADVDSFSGRSSCGITLDCPSEHFADVFALYAQALLCPSFSEEEIERERRDTLAALARREDRLAARAFDLFAHTHWEHHPYRLPILGDPESVTRFARDELVAHHEHLVRAGNLVIAVVGDVDPDRVAALAQRCFAELPGGGRVEDELPAREAPPPALRTAVEHKDRAQAHLVIGFRGLDVHDPGRHALEVLCQVLSGQGGRLFLELRDRHSLAYSVGATNVEGVAPGFFAVSIATAPEKLDDAERGLLGELRRLLDAPPEAAELERARRGLLGGFAIERQRSAARALQLALDTRYGLEGDFDRDYPERIRAVSSEDVLRVARRVIRLDAYTLASIRP